MTDNFFEEFFTEIFGELNEYSKKKEKLDKSSSSTIKDKKVNGRETKIYPKGGKYVFEAFENGKQTDYVEAGDLFDLIKLKGKDTSILNFEGVSDTIGKVKKDHVKANDDYKWTNEFKAIWDEESLSWEILGVKSDDLFELVHRLAILFRVDWKDLEEFKNRLIVYLDAVKTMEREKNNLLHLLK